MKKRTNLRILRDKPKEGEPARDPVTRTVNGAEYAPLDRVAARVTSPGEAPIEYESQLSEHGIEFDVKPPTTQVPFKHRDKIGHRRGALTCIGFYEYRDTSNHVGKHARQKSKKWVMRCDCGRYVVRSHKSSGKRNWFSRQGPDACSVCKKTRKYELYR